MLWDNVRVAQNALGNNLVTGSLGKFTFISSGYLRNEVKVTQTNPAFALVPQIELGEQVTMLTEMRDTLGLVMLGLGRDPSKATKADVEAAAAKIKKARTSGQIRKFTGNDYAEDLAAGNIAIAFAWSGDIQGLAADNPDLKWIAPKEGAMLYSDNMMIPRGAPNLENAKTFLNWMMLPENAAVATNFAGYMNSIKGSEAFLDESLKTDPAVAMPAEYEGRLVQVEFCSAKALELRDKVWTQLKQ